MIEFVVGAGSRDSRRHRHSERRKGHGPRPPAAPRGGLDLAEHGGGLVFAGREPPRPPLSADSSARETLACIEVAVAMRLIKAPEVGVVDRLNRVIATLVRQSRP
jgi:hypothetical protein